MGTGGLLLGVKARWERDADHSLHLVPRSRMSRSYTSSPPSSSKLLQAPPSSSKLLQDFYDFFVSNMRATYPADLTSFGLINILMFTVQYSLWSCSLRCFLQPPVISSLSGCSPEHHIFKHPRCVLFP
jgi:hypothetical protein